MAYLGLGEYDAAAAVYRELVPNYPAFADRLRLRTDSLAREALGGRAYDQAKKLALLSLDWQPNRPAALTLLLEAQIQLSDFDGAAATAGSLRRLGSQATVEGSRYAFQLATGKFDAGRYSEAAAVASLALELTDAWEPGLFLAKAQFAMADFLAASQTYRKLLSWNPSNMDVVREYAEALAASRPSLPEAVEWLGRASFADPAIASQVQVELAGVILATGDRSSAQRILRDIRYTPELVGRLGWWYYKSGRFSTSAELLGSAVAQRPGDSTLQSSLAFDELEQHQWESAIRRFTLSARDNAWNSPLMGRAVARWEAHQTESALADFEMAGKTHPEGRDPHWVTALYTATVSQAVAEMAAEWRKRQATPR